MVRLAIVLSIVVLLVPLGITAVGSISPSEVVVVYNSSDSRSIAVADYYCSAVTGRDIPSANKLGVDWQGLIDQPFPGNGQDARATDVYDRILADQGSSPGLLSFLRQRCIDAGVDPDDPSVDPTKVIVLCWGLPLKFTQTEIAGSLDSAFTLLLNNNPWGEMSVANYMTPYRRVGEIHQSSSMPNPFYFRYLTDTFDFGDFRASPDNAMVEIVPNFSKVLMLSADRAIAGGDRGLLFTGEKTEGAWTWTAVPDQKKWFIRGDIVDMCRVDDATAVIVSVLGSVLRTTDAGSTWALIRGGFVRTSDQANEEFWSASSFPSQDGRVWAVGYSEAYGKWLVERYASSGGQYTKTDAWGTLPTPFQPIAVAAADATHVWVSGSDGIYFTTDNGATWTQQYSSTTSTGDIWAGKDGNDYVAWAVDENGQLLKLNTDVATWSQVTNPLGTGWLPTIDAFDATHIILTNSESGSFALWNGAAWSVDSSDAAVKSSVAWAGGSEFFSAARQTTIRRAVGSLGSLSWSQALSVADYTWKMRYLVCRLDGYSTPLDSGMPADVKNMIDRSIAATNAGPSALANAKFVLDGPWKSMGHYSAALVERLEDMVGTQNVVHDEDPAVYRTSVSGSVVGYTSTGSYHPNVHAMTTWYRPENMTWADGAIGGFKMVSGDALTIRDPRFLWSFAQDSTNVTAHQLTVYLPPMGSTSDERYKYLWLRLKSVNESLLAETQFTEMYTVDGSARRAAVIDLATVNWPASDADRHAHIEVYLPGSAYEAWHPDQYVNRHPNTWDSKALFYDLRDTGVTLYANVHQSLATELIRLGCSGVVGNVYEPFIYNCPVPEKMFLMYAGGCSWAESAYMSFPAISWVQVAIGDPLMRPFAMHPPTASLADPIPAVGARVAGPVSVPMSADATVTSAAFWALTGNKRTWLAKNTESPFECVWDTLKMVDGDRVYPDGTYAIQAVAYRFGSQMGRTELTRSVTIDSALPAVQITSPEEDERVIVTPYDFAAAVTGGTPDSVKFWRFGVSGPTLMDEDTSAPFTCNVTSDNTAEGWYELQAVGYGSSNPYASYSPRRRVLVLHHPDTVSTIGDLQSATPGDEVLIADVPAVLGTYSIGGSLSAFYIEDPSRAAGILVRSSTTVHLGDRVTVRGILKVTKEDPGDENEPTVTERYIKATDVWVDGTTELPEPLAMSTRDLGGKAPDGYPGITGGTATYNLGLLATVCGRVTYVGPQYEGGPSVSCVDDGGAIDPANSLDSHLIWSTVEVKPGLAKGVYVSGSLRLGEYARVTGVSSSIETSPGSGVINRLLFPSDSLATPYVIGYGDCQAYEEGLYAGGSPDLGGVHVADGARVRLYVTVQSVTVRENAPDSLTGLDEYTQYTCTINSTTTDPDFDSLNLSEGQHILVLGTVQDDQVDADLIYDLDAPQQWNSMRGMMENSISMGSSILSVEQGSISQALTQTDGAFVTLNGVQVASVVDGYFGVREMTEVLEGDPRLLVSRSCQVLPSWSVDVQGTITTLASGQRAIVPASVWLYTYAQGRPAPPYVSMMGASWPHKQQIQ